LCLKVATGHTLDRYALLNETIIINLIKMEKKLFTTAMILIFSISFSFGQILKLKSTSLSFKVKLDYGWSDWADWEETSVLITVDSQKDRIIIYSKEKQIYDIAENEGTDFDSDGDETLSLYCVDKDGLTCRIRFVTLHSNNEQLQLYVDYKDIKWVYNVYILD